MRTSFWTRYKDFILPLLAAALAFVGGLLGARFTLPIDVQLEQQKTLLELRRAGYADFFEGQASARIRGRFPDVAQETRDNQVRIAKSKFFVAVFGSLAAADAMATYFYKYITPLDPRPCDGSRDKFTDDIQIYRQMRRELFGDEGAQLSDEKMAALLFDCLLPPAVPNSAGGPNQ